VGRVAGAAVAAAVAGLAADVEALAAPCRAGLSAYRLKGGGRRPGTSD
jgi:hypothetical protein